MLFSKVKNTPTTVCFFSTATKDDAITQLIEVSLISAIGHFEVYCLAFMPVSSRIFPKYLVDFFPSFLSFFFFLSIEDSMFFLRERKQREMTFLKAPPNFDKMSFFPYDFKARSLKFENTSYD